MKINIVFDKGFIVECYVQEPLCFSSLVAKIKDIAPTLQDFDLLWKGRLICILYFDMIYLREI